MSENASKSGATPMPQTQGFRELVGYSVKEWRQGYAEITLELSAQHSNRMGIVHGGVYMTILDAAMGHAATWAASADLRKRCVTVSMTTSFMRSTKTGGIVAIGELAGVHDRIATCRGRIISDPDGTLLMSAQACFRYL